MRSKLLVGGLGVAVAFLLATNPLVAEGVALVTSADIVNSTIRGKDVKNDSLKGKDIKESTLAVVPNSGALGGKPAGQFATTSEFTAVSAFDGLCDPSGLSFTTCASTSVTLARPSRLLLTSHTPFGDDSADGARGTCRLVLDGVPLPDTTTHMGTDDTGVEGDVDVDNAGMGVTNVTAVIAAGAHTVAQQCNQTVADIDFNDLSMSVLVVPAG